MLSPLDEMIVRDQHRERDHVNRRHGLLQHQVTMTRVYKRARDFQDDLKHLQHAGWRVERAWHQQPRVSLDSIRAGTPAALIRVPCKELMVVYARPAAMRGNLGTARLVVATKHQWRRGRRTLGRTLIQAGAAIAGICAANELETGTGFRESD